ncbi:MAG: metalloregulator ArsR/SmtB family transcription factor [Pseudomonadota bacterium]
MKEEPALDILGALSQQTRLRIVRYLVRCGSAGASAGDVGAEVDASSSRASFHLSALENAGVVTSERQSRKIIYRADFRKLGQLISFLLEDCCGNHPEILACCSIPKDCC